MVAQVRFWLQEISRLIAKASFSVMIYIGFTIMKLSIKRTPP